MSALDNDWWLDKVHNKVWAIRQAGASQDVEATEAVEVPSGSSQKRKRTSRPTSDQRHHVLTEDGNKFR
eukprot:4799582-Amphidinium_carterae.1